MEGQMVGTYHTVELAAHLALMRPPPAAPPSTAYAQSLFNSYCAPNCSFPVAFELQPNTLQALQEVLESAQSASPPAESVPASTFDALLDELCAFLLDHFPPFLKSSELVYSGVERVLLAAPGSGPQELMFSVARKSYVEELPLFIIDFHAAQARFRRMLPPRVVSRIKQWEADRRNGKAIAGASAAAAAAAAASASSSSSSAASSSFAPLPSLDDGYDIDASSESSWVLSNRHQKLLDEGVIPKEIAIITPRPELPLTADAAPSVPAPSTPQTAHLPTIIAARLGEVQALFEKYLQPSSSSQQKHMLQSALVAMAPANALAYRGAASGGLRSGTSMTASHPLFRRAEFAISDLPYYLLRNFLDAFHMGNKYSFLSESLENSLQAIKLWVVRDMTLRRGMIKRYHEEMHFGMGVELGLAHGVAQLTAQQMRAQEAEGWTRGDFDPAPKPPRSRPPSPTREVREALQAQLPGAAHASAASLAGEAPPPLRRAYSDGSAPELAEWISNNGAVAPLITIESHPAATTAAGAAALVALSKQAAPAADAAEHKDADASTAAASSSSSSAVAMPLAPAAIYRSPGKPRFVPARSGGAESFVPPHTRVPSATLLVAEGSAPLLQLLLGNNASHLSPANSPRLSRTASPSLAAPLHPASALSPASAAVSSSSSLSVPASDPLLPALPFLPPQRSFRFPTVGQYRKHVMLLNKRLEKEEEERNARRESMLPPLPTAAPASASATSGPASSAEKNAANGTNKVSTPRAKPKRLQFGGGGGGGANNSHIHTSLSGSNGPTQHHSSHSIDAPMSPPQLSSSATSSSAASSVSFDDRPHSSMAMLHSPRVARHRSVQSGDDLDLFMLRERAPHLLPLQCADADAIDATLLGDGSRKRQLFEQIQSMRSVQDAAIAEVDPNLLSAPSSAASSPQVPPRSLPSSPARPSSSGGGGGGGGGGLRSTQNTPRAVRFPAILRHEVREFDPEAEAAAAVAAAAVAEKEAKSKSGKKEPAAAAEEQHRSVSVNSSPSVTVRSILKRQPSRSTMVIEFDSAHERSHNAAPATAGANAADADADSPSPDPLKTVPRSDSASNCMHSPIVGASSIVPSSFPLSSSLPSSVVGSNYSDAMRLIFQQRELESARLIRVLQAGAVFWKFHHAAGATTMPSPDICPSEKNSGLRFVRLNAEATEIEWSKITSAKPHAADAFKVEIPRVFINEAAAVLLEKEEIKQHTATAAAAASTTAPSSSADGAAPVAAAPAAAEGTAVASISSSTVTLWRRLAKPGLFRAASKPKTRLLADALRLFPDSFHSASFLPYNAVNLPAWLCLTLSFADRSYDLVALGDRQHREWFFGLQALCPLNPTFKSAALFQWHRLKLKIQAEAKEKNCTIAIYCRRIVTQARREMQAIKEAAAMAAAGGNGAASSSTLALTAAAKSPPMMFEDPSTPKKVMPGSHFHA